MKIKILTVAAKAPGWVQEGYTEYAKRMPKGLKIELIEIPPSKHANDSERFKSEEGERILSRIRDDDWVIALDEHGTPWESAKLAESMEAWQMQGKDVVFAIGGSDGLSNTVKSRANQTMSLSKLTFPHHLVRVIVAEALYRAWTISNGHPYHRA